ncbi:DUF262 domain-containing protein [Niallia taxi]|uniref:DUF262 domain-containing protein n=1 Tax=Niallia taxi TaxID=2499688 RepID=UPI0015F518CA|nr:DUF262 domain-containing protein [Niallia taxi]
MLTVPVEKQLEQNAKFEVVKKLQISEKQITIEQLYNEHLNQIRFDLAIQRGENIWSHLQKSEFIHTLLEGYPFPDVYSQIENGYWFMLDGKQRMTCCFQFLNNEFSLHPETPDVYGSVVANKKFEELPADLQRKMNGRVFDIVFMENLSAEQRRLLFKRLNKGVPLTRFELERSSSDIIAESLTEMAKHPFFKGDIAITATQRKRMVDQQVVLSVQMMLDRGFDAKGYDARHIQSYMHEIKDEIEPIQIARITKIADYLHDAVKDFSKAEKRNMLSRADVIVLFVVAEKAIRLDVLPGSFSDFLNKFFVEDWDKESEYALLRKSKSTSLDHVKKRYDLLLEEFEQKRFFHKEYKV